MAEYFPLSVVTPTGVIFDGQVRQVTAVGPLGEFGVLAEHINFITSLLPGLLRVERSDGVLEIWVISGGLAEVKDGSMTVLASGAQSPATINRAQAESEEREANELFASTSYYDANYHSVEEALLLARARTQAVGTAAAH